MSHRNASFVEPVVLCATLDPLGINKKYISIKYFNIIIILNIYIIMIFFLILFDINLDDGLF